MTFIVATAAVLILGLAILNLKSLPFAHSIRLLGPVVRLIYPRLRRRSGTKASPPRAITYSETTRVACLDLDINLHMSNSCFFKEADISRAELLSRLFPQALVDISATEGKGGRTVATNVLLAGTQGRFLRELKPFQPYTVVSGVLTWDDAGIHVVTYFVRRGSVLGGSTNTKGQPSRLRRLPGPLEVLQDEGMRKSTYAILVTRYVVRMGRAKVAPAALLGAAGLLPDEDAEAALLERDRVVGLEYLKTCMV